jgi:hypothetical protein
MKTSISPKQESNDIIIYRYKIEDLEKRLTAEHDTIKTKIAIPLAQDLGKMKPSKPESSCEKDVYSIVIEGAYSKMMMTAKKELQSEIESFHIISEKQEADIKLKELSIELEKTETEHRLKKRELAACDDSLLKKATRYKWTRLALVFLVLVDTLLSGTSLQAMGYPLIVSYVIGLAIGLGIFFLAENLGEIIAKGKTPAQKRMITVAAFIFLFIIFYILGIFRTTTFNSSNDFGSGVHPLYFACLNLFFSIIAFLVVEFRGLNNQEKKLLDRYNITKEAVKVLDEKIQEFRGEITSVRKVQAEAEVARRQIQIYAQDIQELIQRLFEDSQKTFYSTNCIHRSDGEVPKFFGDPISILPSFHRGLKL